MSFFYIIFIIYVRAKKYHSPLALSLNDSHCHVNLFFKYGLDQHDFHALVSHGRKMIFIDNRRQHYHYKTS